MRNIKLYLNVRLIEHPVWDFSDKNEKAVLYPFKSVEIFAEEIHICPFCGKAIEGINCNCKEFEAALKDLQDHYGDKEHKSQLHSWGANSTQVLFKPISDFQFRTLEKSEISELEEAFWDPMGKHIDKQEDSYSSRHYKVSPVNYDGKNYFFICADLISKSVYRFDVPPIKYKAKQIYLRLLKPNKLKVWDAPQPDNNRSWKYPGELAEFENWNSLCVYLKFFKESAGD